MAKNGNFGKTLWMLAPTTLLFIISLALLAGDGLAELGGCVMTIIFFIVWVITIIFGTKFLFGEGNGAEIIFLWSILLIELAVHMFLTAPWYQWLAMWFHINPWVLEAIIISFIIGLLLGLVFIKKDLRTALSVGIITFLIACVILMVIFSVLSGGYAKCTVYEKLATEEIADLPATDDNYTRTAPMKTSDRMAKDTCQIPQFSPETPPDITMIGDIPHFGYVLSPDGPFNHYTEKSTGMVFVDMTTIDKRVFVEEISLEYAPGQAVKDDIYWQLFFRNYWINAERTKPLIYNNSGTKEYYLAVPYITYETRFTFPIWYTIPKWGGVFLVDSEGNIEDLSPEQARNHPVLKGQSLFPEKLVLEYVDSQKYWKANNSWWDAVMNVWVRHEQEIVVTDVSGQGNQQPFLLNTVDGFKWVVCTEPWGGSRGIYRIFLFDARDENVKVQVKKYSSGNELGPVKACDYVRKNNAMVDWSTFSAIEPIPVTPLKRVLWEVRVVPADGSGISYIAFVDPINGKVCEFKTDEEIRNFLDKGEEQLPPPASGREIQGMVIDVHDYIQDGNTRWLITIGQETNQTINYVLTCARVEDFDLQTRDKIENLQIGDEITVIIAENNIIQELQTSP
ncbi:MAG: hypothetical protein NTU58_02460 [Candidatus Nealsonbacteria bacterium]|nr:hypothetical protein [Candidatus Nealsonbacteria bacterium]